MSQVMNRTDSPEGRLVFRVEGMHCGSCVARIEQGLKRQFPAISDVRVNLATGQAALEGSVAPDDVVAAIHALGYEASLLRRDNGSKAPNQELPSADANLAARQARHRLVLAVGLTVPLFGMHMLGWHVAGSGWLQFTLATIVLFYCGQGIFKSAWQLLKRFETNMDTLIALGSGVAWLASTVSLLQNPAEHAALYFESAAMIVTLILLGRYLEARARGKAGEAIESLMRLQPVTALVQQNGEWVETPVENVRPDDRILVRPGAKIPLDGTVVEGESAVDESMMTGESEPVSKQPGSEVIGGTQNHHGALTVRVSRVGADTTLSRMIALVQQAQGGKPAVQRLADQVAGVFVPVVLGLALLTLIGWLGTGHVWAEGLQAAIAVLVIACPCALGLATPTAVQVGLGRAATEGILIRDTDGLEMAHRLDILVMDKTGTLTLGQPGVLSFCALEGFEEANCIKWAAALEARSEHPLAEALTRYATAQSLDWQACRVADFTSQAGAGVTGHVDGQRLVIGKPPYIVEQGVIVAPLSHRISQAAEQGQTPVVLAVNGKLAGLFLLGDPLKENAPEAIRRLRRMGVRPFMLSGDRQETAVAIGKQAGLGETEVRANMAPQQKLEFLKDLQREGDPQGRKRVGMVGDGVNDAPALAQADVSIAMGTGTDIAMQAAQITLVHGDIAKAVDAVALSRAILRVIRQNLFWAFFYNVVAIPAAALGFLTPAIAAAAMSLSSITVVLNSLRLKSLRF